MTTDPLRAVARDLDPGQDQQLTPTPETKAMPAAETTTSSGGGQVVELATTDQQGRVWNSAADFGPLFVLLLGIALFLVARGCTAEDDPTGGSTAPSMTSPATTTPWCSPGWAPHPDDPSHCHPEEWRNEPLPEGTRGGLFDREPRDPWGSSTADPWSNVPSDQLPRPEDFPDPTGPYFPTETETNTY